MAKSAPKAVVLTPGEKHYFFGYYDKFAVNASCKYALSLEVSFIGRKPTEPGDYATIGLINLAGKPKFTPIVKTYAWNWQQGAMLEWWATEPENHIVYNDRRDGQFVAVIRDVQSGKERVLPKPIAAVSRDGSQALSVNFSRVAILRPGYGYEVIPDQWEKVEAPEDDGIYHMDMMSGKSKLIISLRQLADFKLLPSMNSQRHYVNHVMFTPNGKRIVMLHRWGDSVQWKTRMNTSNPDGSDMYVLNDDDMTSHFDWRDNNHVIAWAGQKGIGDKYFLFTDKSKEVQVVGDGLLTLDGHMTYSPDRRWLLTDYATRYKDWRKQFLLLYHLETNKRVELGEFSTDKPPSVDMRCDTHPRWNPDGKGVTFDGMLDGRSVVYMMDVSETI